MLPTRPPERADSSLIRGDVGWSVYGLQLALNRVQQSVLVGDGDFGPATELAVKTYQRHANLEVDGNAGPATQFALEQDVIRSVALPGIPVGLAKGIVEGEGGPLFGSVNWSSFARDQGVDCGIVQEHCLEVSWGDNIAEVGSLRHAFHPARSLVSALQSVLARADQFSDHAWAKVSRERALRCAIMAHNWPVGALAIAKTGKCPSPDSVDGWWPVTLRFPDGAPVRTRWEFCQWYAMGGPHGPARIPKYVTSWA